jgi:adenylate kinase
MVLSLLLRRSSIQAPRVCGVLGQRLSAAAQVRDSHNQALIMGPPGGGKGTLSKRISAHFGYAVPSTGDLIRNQIQNETEMGLQFKALVNAGKLVPAEVVMGLVESELAAQGGKWMLDGFPRSTEQALLLDNAFNIDFVINIDVPQDIIVERLTARWCHMPSGRIYHTEFNPPKVAGLDDETGEPLEQRDDDKPETILARLALYEEETRPLIAHYEAKGVLRTFTGTESDVIYPAIHDYMENELGLPTLKPLVGSGAN